MKAPSSDDKVVKVSAFMTDLVFGYDNWHAQQYSAPEGSKPAILIIYDSKTDRDNAIDKILEYLNFQTKKQ